MKEYKAAFTGKRDINIYVRAINGYVASSRAIDVFHNMFGPCPDEPYVTEVVK